MRACSATSSDLVCVDANAAYRTRPWESLVTMLTRLAARLPAMAAALPPPGTGASDANASENAWRLRLAKGARSSVIRQ